MQKTDLILAWYILYIRINVDKVYRFTFWKANADICAHRQKKSNSIMTGEISLSI